MAFHSCPTEYVELIEKAVLSSAQHMKKFFSENRQVEHKYKSDDSIVMNLDIQSQELMLAELQGHLPIVAEEDPDSHLLVGSASDFFLVDPLDGTASAKRFQGVIGGQVGFGPLAGVVLGGRLVAASFVSLPLATLFTAVQGEGVWIKLISSDQTAVPPLKQRQKLCPNIPSSLRECGVLFFPGSRGEVSIVERLRTRNVVENMYRFGGFASDCARLAFGHEQIQIQFSVKAWDFSASLFVREVGLQVICDPLNQRIPFDQWRISHENPVISCPPLLLDEFLSMSL